jgi:DNA invertase Pin-like site-specific DNA recombinase
MNKKLAGFIPGIEKGKQAAYKKQIKALANDRELKYFVEKGSNDAHLGDREELNATLNDCRTEDAVFAVASVRGLTPRKWSSLQLLNDIADLGIAIEVADDPTIDKHSIVIQAFTAEIAREKILTRSREAVQEIKDRLARGEVHVSKSGRKIKKLGAATIAEVRELSEAGNEAKKRKADLFAQELWPTIEPMIARGMTKASIASQLNRLGYKTARGGRFYQSTISAILRRVDDA